MRARIGLLIFAAAALGGCAYGYDPYSGGYGGVGVSLGYGNYGYGYPYGYGYGYGYPYGGYGWYNGFYYPGTGYYVYDRHHHRREMTDAEKRYWRERVAQGVADGIRDKNGGTVTQPTSAGSREVARPSRTAPSISERREAREVRRDTVRSRSEARRAARSSNRGGND